MFAQTCSVRLLTCCKPSSTASGRRRRGRHWSSMVTTTRITRCYSVCPPKCSPPPHAPLPPPPGPRATPLQIGNEGRDLPAVQSAAEEAVEGVSEAEGPVRLPGVLRDEEGSGGR